MYTYEYPHFYTMEGLLYCRCTLRWSLHRRSREREFRVDRSKQTALTVKRFSEEHAEREGGARPGRVLPKTK